MVVELWKLLLLDYGWFIVVWGVYVVLDRKLNLGFGMFIGGLMEYS